MKYSTWIGAAACVLLIIACFIPWTYHADVQKHFTGFYSEAGTYGKPGKFIVFFAIASLLLLFVKKIWAKRVHIFVAGLLVAYTIKTYILYTSCYNAYCPEKKLGIYLVLALPVVIFIASLLPDIKMNKAHTDQEHSNLVS
jgi:hypothetical protein